MRRASILMAVALLAGPAHAWEIEITPKGDISDLRSHEQEAAYTTTDPAKKTVTWTSRAVKRPTVEKHNDRCASIPTYMDGMICERMCGGSLTSAPVKWDAKWRPAGFGHDVQWRECNNDNRCVAFSSEYYPQNQRGCVHFGIWGAANPNEPNADFQVTITLK